MLVHFLSPFAWALFILLLYGLPGNDLPGLKWMDLFSFDKLAHAGFFAIFVHLLIVAFRRQNKLMKLKYFAIRLSVLIGAIYGVFLEFTQSLLFEQRTTDWLDMVANMTGCLLGVFIFRMIYGKELFFYEP